MRMNKPIFSIIEKFDNIKSIMTIHRILRNITMILVAFLVGTSSLFAQNNDQKENVIAQMNYCINSLTNIIHNKSMSVLEHESDQILNNLTMQHIVGLYEINDFRIDLLDAVSTFNITEQERALLRRIQSIKRDNMKWAAISNALDPTMLLTGTAGPGMAYQAAFQVLLTAARSAVEYQTMKGEQNIEELRAMWDLRKQDLMKINETRKEALKLVYSLYEKYNLDERDRLTEATANYFSTIISEENPERRARLLSDNRATYEHMADYFYYLGMAYLDCNNYSKARDYFTQYISKYKKAPLFRYDKKSGCIALAILANDKDLSASEKMQYIEIALKNLPHNSPAIMQCAMIYMYDFKDYEKALSLIRAGIEDPNASDKSLLLMAVANLSPILRDYPVLYSEIKYLFTESPQKSFDSYITYIINTSENVWDDLNKVVAFGDEYDYIWLCWPFWKYKYFNDEFHIILPENIIYDSGDISIYVEEHSKNELEIYQLTTKYVNGVDIEDINDVDCFKANEGLKYLFFDVLEANKTFILKKNLDYNKIKNDDFPGRHEFSLYSEDIEDIIDFCKDNTPKSYMTELECEELDAETIKIDSTNYEIEFAGKKLNFNPLHFETQEGTFVRIVLENGISLLYKYENEHLVPYLYAIKEQMYFAREEYKQESMSTPEPSLWKKMTVWVSSIWETLSSKSSDLWNEMVAFFTSEEETSIDENPEVVEAEATKAEENDTIAWWKKPYLAIIEFFSGDEDVAVDTIK